MKWLQRPLVQTFSRILKQMPACKKALLIDRLVNFGLKSRLVLQSTHTDARFVFPALALPRCSGAVYHQTKATLPPNTSAAVEKLVQPPGALCLEDREPANWISTPPLRYFLFTMYFICLGCRSHTAGAEGASVAQSCVLDKEVFLWVTMLLHSEQAQCLVFQLWVICGIFLEVFWEIP